MLNSRVLLLFGATLLLAGCGGDGKSPQQPSAENKGTQAKNTASNSPKQVSEAKPSGTPTEATLPPGNAKGTPDKPRMIEQNLKNSVGFWQGVPRAEQGTALRGNSGSTPKPGIVQFFVYDTTADDGRAKHVNHGKFTAKLENGQVYEEGQYEHGKQVGVWTEYQRAREKQGNRITDVDRFIVWRTTTYKAGLKDGPYTRFDPFGNKQEEGGYTAGKKSGLWKLYKDGLISEEVSYQNDLKHGPAVIYGTSSLKGQVNHYKAGEGQYARGERTGTWTLYDPSGRTRTQNYK